ncbi:hypothetical protein [Calothrix sp. 336/3]
MSYLIRCDRHRTYLEGISFIQKIATCQALEKAGDRPIGGA